MTYDIKNIWNLMQVALNFVSEKGWQHSIIFCIIFHVQMVTTVFHQYEVGMREACIEAKASRSVKEELF